VLGVAREGLYSGTYTDRFGWEEKAATVARVYERLPAGEERAACVLAGNYGEAAAIDFSARTWGCRVRSAATTATTCGAREDAPGRS
jgi:hypothetical protein